MAPPRFPLRWAVFCFRIDSPACTDLTVVPIRVVTVPTRYTAMNPGPGLSDHRVAIERLTPDLVHSTKEEVGVMFPEDFVEGIMLFKRKGLYVTAGCRLHQGTQHLRLRCRSAKQTACCVRASLRAHARHGLASVDSPRHGLANVDSPLGNERYYMIFSSCCCACRTGSGAVVHTSRSITGPWTRQPRDVNCKADAPVCSVSSCGDGQHLLPRVTSVAH